VEGGGGGYRLRPSGDPRLAFLAEAGPARPDPFPERDPILGWYEEGNPEVADWHIKWACENGISFFVYDWYWREGREVLNAALKEGFLKARYSDRMKFALMWANHKPFSNHTESQLLRVADYWIENYFRRANYLKFHGKPYVSFFAPRELFSCLGPPKAVRKAFDAVRRRVRAAGLAGLHIAACGGMTGADVESLRAAGFDSVTAYNYVRTGAATRQSDYRGFVLGHERIWNSVAEAAGGFPYLPVLTVGWDPRPWHGGKAIRFFARRTRHLKDGLRRLKEWLDTTGGRTALLEAWNEWGEGSYLEPNAEFGFRDVEAVRAVFGKGSGGGPNVGPSDIGRAGEYDLRREAASRRALSKYGKKIELCGKNPVVREGLELRVWCDRIEVGKGKVSVAGKTVKTEGGVFRIEPSGIRLVRGLELKARPGAVQKWRGGNRLLMGRKVRRNPLPGSFVRGSLRVVSASSPHVLYEEGRDFVVDDEWGAFTLEKEGRIKPGARLTVYYRLSLRRIDLLVSARTGEVRLIKGKPSPDCPRPPVAPARSVTLASIYRPFNASSVEPYQVYVYEGVRPDLSAIRNAPGLSPVLEKLRKGREVTIVCWGDSVTAGGDASSPEMCYVRVFERRLRERFPRARIRVINAGVGGSSTWSRLPRFEGEVLRHRPDLVTVEFVNDMGLPEKTLERNYTEIMKKTRAAGAALILITPHFTMPDWMGFGRRARGPDRRPAVAFLRRFARNNGIPLADVSKRWESLEKEGIPYETLLKNGVNHPGDRGHVIFAEELMRFFP